MVDMKELPGEIINFLQRQHFVIVCTVDRNRFPHTSCKGIVDIDKKGKIYLLDLYRENTYRNLKENPYMSITAVDEHKFVGFCIKGIGQIVKEKDVDERLLNLWKDKLVKRITSRVIRNLQSGRGQGTHPEATFPYPKHLIEMKVTEIVDLSDRKNMVDNYAL